MKRTLSLLLCLCMIIALVPAMSASAEAETISYLAAPQGKFENVAAGKPVGVSSAVLAANGKFYKNGRLLTDERQDTFWESDAEWFEDATLWPSQRNLDEGAFAVINLGAVYPIYRIEVVAEEAALKNYRVEVFDAINYDTRGTELMYHNTDENGGVTTNATLVSDNQNGTGGLVTKYEGEWQTKLATAYVNLNGFKASKIRFEKTAAEAAKIAEIRVYSVVPDLEEVTPTDASQMYTNATAITNSMTQTVDKKQTTFSYLKKLKTGHLHLTYDLGAKYKVRRVELWTRSDYEHQSRKEFGVWTGNADSITSDITTDATGYRVGSSGIEQGLRTGKQTGIAYTSLVGGNTVIFDQNPKEATQYVTVEWTTTDSEQFFSLAEIRIFAEKTTTDPIELTNVAEDIVPTTLPSGYLQYDLGALYNVKRVDMAPASAIGSFSVVGTTTEKLGVDEAILAADPNGISEATNYDAFVYNVVRYITVKAEDAANLGSIKVWAENGKSYENIALGKVIAAENIGGLADGNVESTGYSFHKYESQTSFAAANPIVVDLANSKKINAVTISFEKNRLVKDWERKMFQVWGANQADYSDATLLTVQGTKVAAPNHSWTVFLDTDTSYRYILFSARHNSGHGAKLAEERYYYSHYQLNGGNERLQGITTYYWPKVNNTFDGNYYSAPKTEKVWSEIQVYTEVLDVINAAAGKGGALTDSNPATIVDLATNPVITLDRIYPITNVAIDRAATSAITVSAKKAEADSYTVVGTIAAGTTELDFAGAEYRFIQLSAANETEVAEVIVNVDSKYYGKDMITKAYSFVDPNGNLLSSTLGVSITVKNIAPEAKETIVILGLFDANNTLLSVGTSAESLSPVASGAEQTFTASVTNPGNLTPGCYLKAFVWEGVSGANAINPLTGAQSLIKK